MELYAYREGSVQVAHTTFDAGRGISVAIRLEDGQAIVNIEGVAGEIIVCEGLPLKITAYHTPDLKD